MVKQVRTFRILFSIASLALSVATSAVVKAAEYDATRNIFRGEVKKQPERVTTGPRAGMPRRLGEELYGSDIASLMIIDKLTSDYEILGPLGTNVLASLAYDCETQLLYGTDTSNSNLVIVDQRDGRTTTLGATGIYLPHGSAIDPATGSLFVSGDEPGTLFRVDKATGDATAVGPIGFDHIGALDFDPTTGFLYGAYGWADQSGLLVTIDTETGRGTFVASTHRLTAIAFDEEGNLFAADNGSSAGAENHLYRVDKATGAWTRVGGLGFGNVLALEFDGHLRPPSLRSGRPACPPRKAKGH